MQHMLINAAIQKRIAIWSLYIIYMASQYEYDKIQNYT